MLMKKFTIVLMVLVMMIVTGSLALAYDEAPMLKAKVAAGELEPVDERLPENPLVIEPLNEVGQYGGTLRRVYNGMGDTEGMRKLSHVGLVSFSSDGKEIVPSLAEKYEISEDGLTFTFYLRKGIKWSDGDEYNADDIMYWYEHELLNEELNPSLPANMRVAGKPVVVKKIDDYTVQFKLPAVSAVFLKNMAVYEFRGSASHYMKQFHPDFVDKEELDKLVSEESFDNWTQLYEAKGNQWSNPEKPSLRAWIPVSVLGDTVFKMVRNPYYWRVDTEGNQLPYIDSLVNNLVSDPENITLSIVAGEIDFLSRHVSFGNYPLFMENRDKGDYQVNMWSYSLGSSYALMPNLNHKDPVLREIFQDRRFRIALSHGLDRDEINEILFLGVCKPRAATVVPGCPFYEEDLQDMYAEYDLDKANALLDEMGLERGADGIRLRPDGKPLAVTITTIELTKYGDWPDIIQMAAEDWKKLGIKTEAKVLDRSLYQERYRAAQFDIAGWAWGRGFAPLIAPKFVFPFDDLFNSYPLWGAWYQSGGAEGEEPPADSNARKAQKLYDKYVSEPNPDKRLEIGKELIRLSTESCWAIGTVGEFPLPVIVKNNLENVPEKLLAEHLMATPSNAHPEQFFFKN